MVHCVCLFGSGSGGFSWRVAMGWFILFGIILHYLGPFCPLLGTQIYSLPEPEQGSPLYVGQALSIPAWMTSRAAGGTLWVEFRALGALSSCEAKANPFPQETYSLSSFQPSEVRVKFTEARLSLHLTLPVVSTHRHPYILVTCPSPQQGTQFPPHTHTHTHAAMLRFHPSLSLSDLRK